MQTANIMLALGGDLGTQVQKSGVTASEIAVLRTIHGEGSVLEIEPGEDIERSDREEIQRLRDIYGRARVAGEDGNPVPVVSYLFPGGAARAFQKLKDLDIPEDFYKPKERAKPQDPLDHDGDGRKGGSLSQEAREAAGLDGMTKAELVEYAEAKSIDVNSSDTKAVILETIKKAEAGGDEPASEGGIFDE